MLINTFLIWRIYPEKLWRKVKTSHKSWTYEQGACTLRWRTNQRKNTHTKNKLLNADNKVNTLCRSYLQSVEMLSRVQHELFSQLLISCEKPCFCVWARECVLWKCVCVISPWKVFPHSRDPTSLWQRGGGRRAQSVWWSTVTADK